MPVYETQTTRSLEEAQPTEGMSLSIRLDFDDGGITGFKVAKGCWIAVDLAQESEFYPEGGHDAWLVVVGAWCAMIPCMGLLNTLAVLQAWVSENELHDLTESTIGWVFSTYAFFLYFCGAQVGQALSSMLTM
ncbi:riboflavin transporter MCH5 [Colletotrichum spaethianum]|uniref:Riboflavin transporter MCH5 n=1 Tax=Colletotrichum spaethianum TaxID=700344 RepID=A0AA37L7B1_9PEZI|nr:riboflavin transporter MCH5 [Colletotrichum spaethianum]GKT43346.1 riboflavin transporter MCH5 [Colletotrichum spaethianum]